MRCLEIGCGTGLFKEIHHLLKPGGSIWFAELNYLNPHIFWERKVKFLREWLGVSDYETVFIRWDLEKKLRKLGFSSVQISAIKE